MSACNYIERLVAQRAIRDIIAAGHHVSINDGEEDVIIASRDERAILAVMFSTDEDQLYVDFDPATRISFGWIRFIYGNDGWDVINDNTTNLTEMLKGTDALCGEIDEAKQVTMVALVDGDAGFAGAALDREVLAYCAANGITADGDVFGQMFSGHEAWTRSEIERTIEEAARIYNLRAGEVAHG